MDRIFSSHVETEQGRDEATTCSSSTACQGELRSQLQPYAIYIPRTPAPSSGYGLTLLLHSLTANYNQFLGTRNQSQFGDRATGSIVITPEGRGPDGWYYDEAGADTFEVWADVAARYHLDPSYTAVSGYSMGGYGTYKFATQFPDLFARAQPVVGPPALTAWFPPAPISSDNTYNQLESLRNVPILIWNGSNDELVPVPGPIAQANRLDALGYRYELDVFTPAEHLTLALDDQYQPAADFLGSARIDYNPSHVTYTYNPSMDFAADGTAAGHAYWLSQIAVRDGAANAGLGTIDVVSHGFRVGDPRAGDTQRGVGTLVGGRIPVLPYTRQFREWGAPPKAATRDVLDITATNTSAVTIDAARARVDCSARLDVKTDGPLQVTLAGCGTHGFAPGHGASARSGR
jgi:dienelactone hydrolase